MCDFMGFRFRQQIGPKWLKLNISKKGLSSASVKIAPGVTLNSKRGTTVGVPGTGMSYNFGNRAGTNANDIGQRQEMYSARPRFSWLWFIFWLLIFFPIAIFYWFTREH